MTILGIDCSDANAIERLSTQHQGLFTGADVISASSKFLESLNHIYGDKLIPLEIPIRPFLNRLGAMSENGASILILADGDPLFFGLASSLKDMDVNWSYNIIPAVSSLQVACSKIGLPWDNMAAFSLHGRENIIPLYGILSSEKNFCFLTGSGPGPDYISSFLRDRGCDYYEVYIFENMGSSQELIKKLSLRECEKRRFSPTSLSIFVLKTKKKTPPRLLPSNYLLGSYCTPETRRGLILELLDIEAEDILWDIGAGSGLMAVEMARRANKGCVWAVEEKSYRAQDIQYNRKILSCPNLNVVWGHAPNILKDLPEPSNIFIGGGLSHTKADLLLDVCFKKLKPEGNIVISCIILENLQKCLNHNWGTRANVDFYQEQISKGKILGGGFRFIAENPAFLIKIHKEI